MSLNSWRDLIPKPLYFLIHLCPLKRFLIRKSGTLSSLFGDEVIEHHPVLLYKILSCWSLMHVQTTPPRSLAFYPSSKLTKSDNVLVPYLLYHCFFLPFFNFLPQVICSGGKLLLNLWRMGGFWPRAPPSPTKISWLGWLGTCLVVQVWQWMSSGSPSLMASTRTRGGWRYI